MNFLSPKEILRQVAESIPAQYHPNIIIVGSLAAGYHYLGAGPIRTKDVDCLVTPRSEASESGARLVRSLLRQGWEHQVGPVFGRAQKSPTPLHTLSAIRLYPPDSRDWFLEFMTEPETDHDREEKWVAVKLENGYFGLCGFEFMPVVGYGPLKSEFGLLYARPEMMALANLLSHNIVGPETMSTRIENRIIRRSNKDLGRVLALARLSGDQAEEWFLSWKEVLKARFPGRELELAARSGAGLRDMLEKEDDFREAFHTCAYGLLAGQSLTLDQLRATAERVLQDAVEPLELWGRSELS